MNEIELNEKRDVFILNKLYKSFRKLQMNFEKLSSVPLIIFFISILLTNSLFAQNDTLALVNGDPITSDEFITRFELTVYPGKGLNADLDEVKREFLYSMVAEKLLANKSSMSSSGQDSNEEYIKNEVKAIFLRDALYRKEVLSKVQVSEAELQKGISYSDYNYIVDTFYFPDSLWADDFYQQIKDRKNSYIYHLSDSLNLCHDTLEIGYGESDETIENSFFDHGIAFNSKPTNTIDGWVIFRIIDKKPNVRFSSVSAVEKSKLVKDIIAFRKSYRLGRDYLLNVMEGITVNVNYRIFNPLVYKIKSILAAHRPSSFEGGYYLSRRELQNLKDNFSFDPRAPMLKFNGGELSLGYILDNLSLAGFAPVDTSIRQITFSLHNAMRFIVQNYFLAQRAEEMGLEESSEVKYNTQTFMDAYLSNRIANEIADAVKITPEELNNFFELHQDEILRNVELRLQIFSLDNIDEAAEVLNRLNKIKNPLDDTTGAVWLQAYQLHELGAVLSEMENGSIYGPLFIKGKYTIFRLLEKKSDISQRDIEKSIQSAGDLLLEKKQKQVLNRYLAGLTNEQPTKIFESKLEKVEVTPIQMLTFRYIGFGGKIIATPTLYPREEWINYLKDKKKVLP